MRNIFDYILYHVYRITRISMIIDDYIDDLNRDQWYIEIGYFVLRWKYMFYYSLSDLDVAKYIDGYNYWSHHFRRQK